MLVTPQTPTHNSDVLSAHLQVECGDMRGLFMMIIKCSKNFELLAEEKFVTTNRNHSNAA